MSGNGGSSLHGTDGAPDAGAVAVIGISTRFPQAGSLSEFRDNLRAGRDSVRPIPPERVQATCLDPDAEYPWQGYLDRIDLFDHEFFGLSRREAEVTDPQHRLALQLTREALENAGYAPSRMRDSRTAVVFSSPTNGYAPLVREYGTLSMIGNIPCGLPARVSHLFGLTGPCYGVDTGCNGSLVAVHQAARELRDDDADFAVAGGVSLKHVVPPAETVGAFPGIASPTAKCRAFDEAADGAAGGEGGAVLLLTTLRRALEEGAYIHAVVRGSAVVHNGRHSATIATPSARSQAEVISKAWQRAGLDIAEAGYVEAHGSGTKLGDAVEVEGLALARGGRGGRLPVGSVKTNLGHLDHAAGVAGLVKTILSVRDGELYPSLHFTRPGEDVDLDGARLDVVTEPRRWEAEVRRAGVSSFSLGGINAHCVVEQPPVPAAPEDGAAGRADSAGRPLLVGLSARNEAGLVTLCEQLSLELRDGTKQLADVALTLNEGRDHHRYRLGMVARSSGELALKLAAHVTWQRLGAAGRAPGQEGRQTTAAPRVVLLLSGDAEGAPAGEGEPLPGKLPLPGAAASRVRAQLAAHAWLKRAGVPVDGLMSSGVSRYAVRYLQGKLPASDTRALREAADAGDEGHDVYGGPVRADRLHAAVEEQLAAGPVVFVELAARGEISSLLSVRLAGRTDAQVLTLGDCHGSALEALGRLYEAQLDLGWPALRGGGDRGPRRLPLPGHPFEGVRCWARPVDDVIRFDGPGDGPGEAPAAPAAPAADPGAGAASGVPAPAPVASVAAQAPGAAGSPPAAATPAPSAEPVPAAEPDGGAAAPPHAPLPPAEPPAAGIPPQLAPAAAPAPEPEAPAPEPEAPAPEANGPEPDASDAGTVLDWLRSTLAELLYADEVPADADYFSIGGNSVIALQLIERALTRFGVHLKLIDVYAHPLVSDLAGALTERMPAAQPSQPADAAAGPAEATEAPAADGSAAGHRLPPVTPNRELTLSYGQERMWFHHQLDPGTTLYNLPGASRLRGEPDLDALRLAWEDLAQRHQALRSNFAEVDGRPQLVVRPELGDFFRVLDVSHEPEPEQAARAAVQAETHWVFDVARDPLVRVTVVRIGPGDYLFCWTMHHGVNDGWAPQILMGELLQFYEARCEGRVHRPEPLPVQYSDYARWQRDLLEGDLLDHELDYWREQLVNPPALELPTDRPRPARMDYAGATHGFTIPGELVRKLRALGSEETATLFMVILTGLNVLLSRWSGQRDVVVGTPTIGRSRPELWGLLGFFNNTIALRTDLSGEPGFRGLLRRVRSVVLGAMEHQEIPFDAVVREVAPDRDPGRNPIFDVMYVHQTLPPNFSFGESTFNPGRPGGEEDETPLFPGLPPGTAKFDITMVVAERPDLDDLEVAVEYATQLFDAGTVAAMSDALVELLRAAVDDPEARYGELPAGPPAPGDAAAPPAQAAPPAPAGSPAPDAHEPAPVPARASGPAAGLTAEADAVTACLRLRGAVDAGALREAFDDLAERHDVLRTRFPVPAAQPLSPFARDTAHGLLQTLDVSGEREPAAAAREAAEVHARSAVDPATGSALRALLVTTAPDEHTLVVTTHREVYDGAQPGVFFGDLFAFYGSRRGGGTPEPTALPVSYDDFARWQRRLRADGLLDGQLAYWQRQLADLKAFEPPADRPRPAGAGKPATVASHEFRVPARLAEQLAGEGTREGLLAGIAAALSLRAGADEAVVGLTEAAPDPETAPDAPSRPPLGEIVGPFANPLAVRVDLADEPGYAELAARVRQVTADAESNGDVPFTDVLRALDLPRPPGRAPLFDVTYAHHRLPQSLGERSGLDVRAVRWPGSGGDRLTVPAASPGTADLAWSAVEGPGPGELSVCVDYRTDMYEATTVEALAEDVVTLLAAGLRQPGVPLNDLWEKGTSPLEG